MVRSTDKIKTAGIEYVQGNRVYTGLEGGV